MAACVKSFVSLLLLVGVLNLLTVSASGEDVNVTFIVPEHLEYRGVLKIVGNSSELGNSNAIFAPVMTWTPRDIWFLTVTLTRGVTYELRVAVVPELPQLIYKVCNCKPTEPRIVTVPSEGEYHVEVLPGYDCNNIPCRYGSESNMFDPIRRVV